METNLEYFRVEYAWSGGQGRTVTRSTSLKEAAAAFQRQNPQVKVVAVEDTHGNRLLVD